jgi:hypothetical protein
VNRHLSLYVKMYVDTMRYIRMSSNGKLRGNELLANSNSPLFVVVSFFLLWMLTILDHGADDFRPRFFTILDYGFRRFRTDAPRPKI